ncbi:hypothetical protein [Flexivirga caeni]|nr:hypothetical protein [Flexivirga caeni]
MATKKGSAGATKSEMRVRWLDKPAKHDYPPAASCLSLVGLESD